MEDKQAEFKKKRNGKKAPYSSFLEEQETKIKDALEELDRDGLKLPKGSTIKFSGTGVDDTRESIRAAIAKVFGLKVAFVEYQKGGNTGYVRFADENVGQSFLDKLTDNKVSFLLICCLYSFIIYFWMIHIIFS